MTNLGLIKRGLRMIGALGLGREPSQAMASAALEALQGYVLSLPAFGVGGDWIDQDVSTDVLAEENDRIRVNADGEVTITLPVSTQFRERVEDVCGCIKIIWACTGYRSPRDGAKVWICDVLGSITPRLYLYRADLGTWVLASALTLDGDSAFNAALDAGLSAMIGRLMAAELGQPVPPQVDQLASELETHMAAMFGPDMQTRVDKGLLNVWPFNIVTG